MQGSVKTGRQAQRVISMERLHEIVNSGALCGLRTDGVYGAKEIGAGWPEGEYTRWDLRYRSGRRESCYTRN